MKSVDEVKIKFSTGRRSRTPCYQPWDPWYEPLDPPGMNRGKTHYKPLDQTDPRYEPWEAPAEILTTHDKKNKLNRSLSGDISHG